MGHDSLDSMMVPSEVIERLTKGSYEDLVRRVSLAVESDSKRFLSESTANESVSPIATFKHYVLVGTSRGEFFRSAFSEARGGEVTIQTAERIDVPVITKENRGEFIKNELDSVIEAFFAGNLQKATERLKETVEIIEVRQTQDPIAAAKRFRESLTVGEWREFVKGKKEEMKDLVQFDESKVEPKFESLNSATEAELAKVSESVRASVAELFPKVETLLNVARESFEQYKESPRQGSADEERVVLAKFEAFAENFLADVGRKLSEARKMTEGSGCAACWAVVHDAFAGIFEDLKVASGLVAYFSEELRS